MLARLSAVVQDVRVIAAGVFQGIGQDRQAVEVAVVVDSCCEGNDGGSAPGRIAGRGPEGTAENATK